MVTWPLASTAVLSGKGLFIKTIFFTAVLSFSNSTCFGGRLARGDLRELSWSDVSTWSQLGGASLGTNRTLPSEIRASVGSGFSFIAKTIARERIDAILVIGGFEAFAGLLELAEARKSYAELCIPMCLVPATISNNVPGTDFSIGCDTAANAISDAIDRLKLSAASSRGYFSVCEFFFCSTNTVIGEYFWSRQWAHIRVTLRLLAP